MDGLVKFPKDSLKPAAVTGIGSVQCSVAHRRGFASRWRGRLQTGKRWGFVGALAFGIACATMPHGATEANMSRARSGAAEGWALFKEHCASCHGERGESVSRAPRIMGEGALPEYPRERNMNADPAAGDPELLRLRAQTRPAGAPWRDPFRTAQDLFGYVSKNMPMPAKKAGSLSVEQYWAIINFMVLAHGVQVPPEGINPGNASSVRLQAGHP